MLLQLPTFQVGVRVRISRGRLTGLTGVVVETIEDEDHVHCVLIVDGWVSGVQLSIAGDALEQIETHQFCESR
jgi:hypothetical protein